MRKGTSIIEYAILISIVVLALVGMAVYMTRAVSGKWREAADSIGFGKQYNPQDITYLCNAIHWYKCGESCFTRCDPTGPCIDNECKGYMGLSLVDARIGGVGITASNTVKESCQKALQGLEKLIAMGGLYCNDAVWCGWTTYITGWDSQTYGTAGAKQVYQAVICPNPP